MKAFGLNQLVTILSRATPAGENLEDVDAAAVKEMTYTLQQGINGMTLREGDLRMTLKMMFLFLHREGLSETDQVPHWKKIETFRGAAMSVSDLFEGNLQLQMRAVEWMMAIDVPPNLTLSGRPFLTPEFVGDDVEDADGDDDTCAFDGGSSNEQAHEPGESSGEGNDRLAWIVQRLERCVSYDNVIATVKGLTGKSPPTDQPRPESPPIHPHSCKLDYDVNLLEQALKVIAHRNVAVRYRSGLKTALRVPEKPSKNSEGQGGGEDDVHPEEVSFLYGVRTTSFCKLKLCNLYAAAKFFRVYFCCSRPYRKPMSSRSSPTSPPKRRTPWRLTPRGRGRSKVCANTAFS